MLHSGSRGVGNRIGRYFKAQSYQFLKWVTGLEQGYVGARASHGFSQLRDASHAWVENNHEVIPSAMRPDREDLRPLRTRLDECAMDISLSHEMRTYLSLPARL